jgi:hypothetical protein
MYFLVVNYKIIVKTEFYKLQLLERTYDVVFIEKIMQKEQNKGFSCPKVLAYWILLGAYRILSPKWCGWLSGYYHRRPSP